MPVILILILMASCSTWLNQNAIKINISDIQPLESNLVEQRFRIKLRMINLSKKDIDLDGLSFNIKLNGQNFASGVSSQSVHLPALSEKILTVDVSTTVLSWLKQWQKWNQNQSLNFDYRLYGRLFLNHGLEWSFSEQGSLAPNSVQSD